MSLKKLPAIWLVTWKDAHVKIGEPGEAECLQRSVGWRVACQRGYVRVAQSICEGDLEDCITIPTAMVKSIVVLRPPGPILRPRSVRHRNAAKSR